MLALRPPPITTCDWSANGYSLLTEAEWEFAARGGNNQTNTTFAGSNTAADVAWHGDNSNSMVHEKGTKNANELSAFDMSGNVWEWCWDYYSGAYAAGDLTDPRGPTSPADRMIRGGSFLDAGTNTLAVAYHGGHVPQANIYKNVGLRLVRRH